MHKCPKCNRAYEMCFVDGKSYETGMSAKRNAKKPHCDYCQSPYKPGENE